MYSNSAKALLLLLAVSACSAGRQTPIQALTVPLDRQSSSMRLPVTAPSFDVGLKSAPLAIGDVFVFDNPVEKWSVVSVDGALVGWVSDSGDFMETTWSTLLPPLRWGGHGTPLNTGQRRIINLQGKLFPLAKGNRIEFLEEAIYPRPGEVINAQWQCEVGERSEVNVAAGKAQAWEVVCSMNGQEKQVLYYAENIGHWVRQVTRVDGGVSVRQLTGYVRGRPAAAAKATTEGKKP